MLIMRLLKNVPCTAKRRGDFLIQSRFIKNDCEVSLYLINIDGGSKRMPPYLVHRERFSPEHLNLPCGVSRKFEFNGEEFLESFVSKYLMSSWLYPITKNGNYFVKSCLSVIEQNGLPIAQDLLVLDENKTPQTIKNHFIHFFNDAYIVITEIPWENQILGSVNFITGKKEDFIVEEFTVDDNGRVSSFRTTHNEDDPLVGVFATNNLFHAFEGVSLKYDGRGRVVRIDNDNATYGVGRQYLYYEDGSIHDDNATYRVGRQYLYYEDGSIHVVETGADKYHVRADIMSIRSFGAELRPETVEYGYVDPYDTSESRIKHCNFTLEEVYEFI